MHNFSDRANFIWGIADLIRDTFKRGKYQDVILPFTVLRRIDCVLEPTKDDVVDAYNRYASQLSDPTQLLCSKSGYAFYNVSPFTFERLLKDAPNLAANLRSYINDFSPNMREVLEKFGFENTIKELDDTDLLYAVMERFKNIDLHPDKVLNHEMGYIFEELIRKFNEALNENPGEHFTPREVIRLMVDVSLTKDAEVRQPGIVLKVYDPCCGTGGMLTTAKDHILEMNQSAQVYLYGQEVNKETFAVCKSDLYMKSRDGRDAEHILFGSTLSQDRHEHEHFHFIFANPPYGKDWKRDQNMLFHMYDAQDDHSQVGIVMNGSPLFTGDAGSGESEIRRWILENDWLETIIALPEQLFYNTGIATYIWILTNRKSEQRKCKVQLINATDKWIAMRKSMGDKRREISQTHIEQIRDLFTSFTPGDGVKIFPYTTFGYRKITVERPLRLNFQVSPERLARLPEQKAFADLAVSKKKHPIDKAVGEEEGTRLQAAIQAALQTLPDILYKNRADFERDLDKALKAAHLKLAPAVRKALLAALSERDETADICRDKDGRIGKVGYEINFNRYFYKYQPPRPLEEIEADIKIVERDILELLREVAG